MSILTMRSGRGWRLALSGALLGAVASAYLLVDYLGGSALCLTGSGCDEVRASAFAYPMGIPMPAIGLAFYLAAFGLLLRVEGPSVLGVPMRTVLVGWALVGVAVSAILTWIELFVIGALCGWCLLSAAASLLLAIGIIGALRTADPEPARTARARRRADAALADEERSRSRFALAGAGVAVAGLAVLLAIPALTSGASGAQPMAVADRATRGTGPQLVVFSDFQCPACAQLAPIAEQLADEGSATLVYRYFPLTTIHANADAAARAAEAARRQDRFWPFHDLLFATQGQWSELPPSAAAEFFRQLAAQAGLDVDTWQADLEGSREAVAADSAEAHRLELRGTPSVFIEGVAYRGSMSLDALRAQLRSVTAAAR